MANEMLNKIEERKKNWEEGALKKGLERFRLKEYPNKFYTPLDIKDHNFLEKVGFPGEYPFTAGRYSVQLMGLMTRGGGDSGTAMRRAGQYSGYGTATDSRDFYRAMQERGWTGGPNIAFDLPSQICYDSDHPLAEGEVGKVGVAVDTLHDFETIYEAFTGDKDLDKIASNFTINAPANIILAMYFTLAEKRGIPLEKLVATPQNDILKEFVSRGTYIFPIKPSMRMTRDTMVFCTEHTPLLNFISICGYHIREAGCSAVQVLGFTLSNAIAFVQLGIDAGLDVDKFSPQMTFLGLSGSMDIYWEIAVRRAQRRMWAKIMRERFGAKNPKSLIFRGGEGISSISETTYQRPLNNLTRTVIMGVASAFAGGPPAAFPPYDEPLGLGWSLEAQQLSTDASRIMLHEANLCKVIDPLAGSYFIESLTDQAEEEAWKIIEKIDAMGGSVAAIENGWMQKEIAQSAYEYQR
ncbi:MAG: methylmalonyl-CoA mutase family protein, partial [Thermodesulfobacteriota bacterium]|nr:methylmalonyl-CoA mutase family protein [Thermodesulfobacteriota bacterium]